MNYDELEGLAQALFEETGDALFLFDPETDQLLDANSTAQRLSGFPLRELRHMTVKDLFHTHRREGLEPLRQASRKTAIFHSQDGYFLHTVQSDVRIPVNLTIARLHLHPKTLGLITARDVRKQYEAHAQLQKMEAELRRVTASVSDCLWSADLDAAGQCAYQYFSPAVERIAGQPPGFFLAGIHRWWSAVHPEDQAVWTRALARMRAGQGVQEEYRVVWPDGTYRWVRESVRVSPGAAANCFRLDGVISDITDRKKSENALRESEDRFQAFMDHSPVVAFMKDTMGRYLYVNNHFQRSFQQGWGDLLGKTDCEVFPAEVIHKFREADARVLATKQPVETIERVSSADGINRPWLIFKFPFEDRSGRLLIGGVGLDLTDRKGLEAP